MRDRAKVWFHTFGCKANQYDTDRIRRELEGRGAEAVEAPSEADVAVVNTCTVTNQADANARHLVRRLRRDHPGLTILVAGCSAALREDRYRALPEVDAVIAGHDPAAVGDALADRGFIAGLAEEGGSGGRQRRGTRAWLKIQDGCDRKCSFCATRIARGASDSRSPAEIVAEAAALVEHHPELVITGIHIGHYGRDLEGGWSLARLCELLVRKVPARIRLGSVEATEIDDHLLDLLSTPGGRLAPHLHVPLQSGSDRVLGAMRRWHTREAYRARVREIAARMPVLGLGADVIVGFPGESRADFADTRSLIEELPYTYLHVFPFSVRDGTVAASLPDRVPGDVAAERSRELRELAVRKGDAYRRARSGGTADVIVEADATPEAPGSGLTGDYLRVEVPVTAAAGDRYGAMLRWAGGRLVARPRGAHPAADASTAAVG